jgi:hypothetical protein
MAILRCYEKKGCEEINMVTARRQGMICNTHDMALCKILDQSAAVEQAVTSGINTKIFFIRCINRNERGADKCGFIFSKY